MWNLWFVRSNLFIDWLILLMQQYTVHCCVRECSDVYLYFNTFRYYPFIVAFADWTTSTLFRHLKWNLAHMVAGCCSCAKHTCWQWRKVCCHGNGILCQKLRGKCISNQIWHTCSRWSVAVHDTFWDSGGMRNYFSHCSSGPPVRTHLHTANQRRGFFFFPLNLWGYMIWIFMTCVFGIRLRMRVDLFYCGEEKRKEYTQDGYNQSELILSLATL